MRVQWTDWAAVVAIAGGGWVALYAVLRRAVRRTGEVERQAMAQRLDAIASVVEDLQARVAELSGVQMERHPHMETGLIAAPRGKEEEADPTERQPEIAAVLAAAATAFLGKEARVRSSQPMNGPRNNGGAWAHQGRVIVQTSHNLRRKN